MEQFTASEVRDAITWKYGDKLTRISAMLTAFADMLEAREIARNDAIEREYERENNPAPSDAERLEPPSNLQEALCVIENAALHGVTLHGDDIPRLRATVDRIAPAQQSQDAERLAEALRKIVEWNPPMTTDHEGKPASMSLMYGSNGVRDYFRNVAREALAAHSSRTPWTEGEKAHFKAAAELVAQREAAQAQPPDNQDKPVYAISRSMHSYYTQDEEEARQAEFDGASVQRIPAQPPVASVTDAMVNRLACWMIAQFGECRAPVDHKARIEWWRNQARSALEAALAAQENPNGL